MGLLTALGLIIGYIEFLIPIPLGIPGVKPGFANIVIVWALYSLGPWEALMINGMRIFLSGFLFGNFFYDPIQSGRSSGKLSVHVSGKEKWAFQYDRCQYDRWCHAQCRAASGGYGGVGNSKSGLLWTGASDCWGDHRVSDRYRDRRSEEKDSEHIGEKDRTIGDRSIVRKCILCILYP